MLFSYVKYGSSPEDYLFLEFYNKKNNERKKFITRKKLNKINKEYNSKVNWDIFHFKNILYAEFSDFIKREWLYLPDLDFNTFCLFIKSREKIVIKPTKSSRGVGVKILYSKDIEDYETLYDDLKKEKYIIEEVVNQTEELTEINPSSLNTMRFYTLYKKGCANPEIIAAFLKVGREGKAVDNLASGGIAVPIDITSGKVSSKGRDKQLNYFDKHPDTKFNFDNVQIKNIDKVCQFVINIAKRYSESRFIGWDIAITPNGPELIEGNYYPCWLLFQSDNIGKLSYFKE